ncbi:765_t:CDS:2, partial [Entrophospora sp. SA101]
MSIIVFPTTIAQISPRTLTVNNIFLGEFWDEMEPSAEEKSKTVRKSKW